MKERNHVGMLHPKQPGFVLVTGAYKKYSLMDYGISHFYQFDAECDFMTAIPDACVDILFYNTDTRLESRVAGTLLTKSEVETAGKCRHFGVRFLPGVNPVLKHRKMSELVSKEQSYEDMFDSNSERDQLFEALWKEESFEKRIKTFLLFYRKNYETQQEAYSLKSYLRKEIMASAGNLKLNELQEKTGYSLRYLNKVITEEFGMGPKELLRIIRFQNAIDELTKTVNRPDMTRAALDTGYYDQSHFIKDFKEFTSHTPSKYLNSLVTNSYQEKLKVITRM